MGADLRRDHLTPGQAARVLGVSPRTVSRWADEGRLTHIVTLGGHRRFLREDVEDLEARLTRAGTGRAAGQGVRAGGAPARPAPSPPARQSRGWRRSGREQAGPAPAPPSR